MIKLFLSLLTVAAITSFGASSEDEQRAIAVLNSAAPPNEKEAACLRLKEIGTAKSAPALKSLLTDEGLAQWALDALETMTAPEAGDALLAALPTVTGKSKAGVLHALGSRRELRAVPEAIKLLSDADPIVARAAAQTLGRMGGSEVVAALKQSRSSSSPAQVKTAVADALLTCADQMLSAGDTVGASRIYQELRAANEPAQVRAAAFRGVVLSAGQRQAALVVEALIGKDQVELAMAVQLVRELPDRAATPEFAGVVIRAAPTVVVAVLEALSQRGDPAAAPAAAAAIQSEKPEVRIAAIRALGELGDSNQVGLLAAAAATGPLAERAEARLALTTLHRGDVLKAILAQIPQASPGVKVELVNALARRGDHEAVPALLRLAATADSNVSVASLQALEKLAQDSDAEAMLGLLFDAKDEACREAAVSAFVATGARSRNPTKFSGLALKTMPDKPVAAQCALLSVAGQIGGPEVPNALRAALRDDRPEMRMTALKVMAENSGDEARPDLLKLAQEAPTDDARAVVLRGYWRLVETMSDRPGEERLAAVRAGLAAAKTPAEQMLGLARLAELRSPAALDFAQGFRADAAIRAEAESACLQIATRLDVTQFGVAQAALRDLASAARNARVRGEAQALVAQLDAHPGYIAPWLVSGPYRQEGKEAQQLFDITFAPEAQVAGKADWRLLSSASNLTNWWRADLDQIVGGNHCVVYLKTRVFCPKEQAVALEIGTDDGVKLWINGSLVHANNAVRGFTAGEDKARATLKEGWNDLLLKITQHTAGCAAAVRVLDADGKPVPGLRVEATD